MPGRGVICGKTTDDESAKRRKDGDERSHVAIFTDRIDRLHRRACRGHLLSQHDAA